MYFDKQFAVRRLQDFHEICGRVPLSFFLENYDAQPELMATCLQYRERNPDDREKFLDFLTDDSQTDDVRLTRFDLLRPFLEEERFMRLVIGSITPRQFQLRNRIATMCHNLENDLASLMRDFEGTPLVATTR